MGERVLKIVEIVGSPLCVASEDGDKVYDVIRAAVAKDEKVRLSFAGVQDLTSAFLNAAIGQLYGEFDEIKIKASVLPPTDASNEDLTLLKRVVERAKEFFEDPDRFRRAAKEVLGDV